MIGSGRTNGLVSEAKVNLSNFQQKKLGALQLLDPIPPEMRCLITQKPSCFTSQILMQLVAFSLTATLPLENIKQASSFSCQWQTFGCIFFDHSCLPNAIQSQRYKVLNVTLHKEDMFSTALGFHKGKRVTDHNSILAPETIVFPKSCCDHKRNSSTKEMMNLSFISVPCINCTQENVSRIENL